jgi:hypothetical protein
MYQNRMVTLLTQTDEVKTVKPKAFTVPWEFYYHHHATSIICHPAASCGLRKLRIKDDAKLEQGSQLIASVKPAQK